MTTTDTDALTERIARAAATSEGFGPDHPDHEVVVGEYLFYAQFLAPFVAVEVRKAKAEALREAAREFALSPFISYSGQHVQERLHSRADRIEAGGSDEHR